MTPLAGVAAVELPALGGASITPANLFLLFYLVGLVKTRWGVAALAIEMGPRRPLFPYLLLVIWIFGSALLMPRLFEGAISVFSLDRTLVAEHDTTLLHPTSGNISQAMYAAGGFAIAALTSTFIRVKNGFEVALQAILVTTWLNIGFALLDLITGFTNTAFVLDIFHTASYSFLNGDELGGLRRLTGSFPEASGFAFFSVSLLAVNFSLFVMQIKTRLTCVATFLLTVFIVLSTSSAGYAGMAALYVVFALYSVVSALVWRRSRPLAITTVLVGCAMLLVAIAAFVPSIETAALRTIGDTLIDKGQSESAYERGTWNAQALQVFGDTFWLGAGIGSTRGSNYALVLLSNLGIIGFVLYAILILRLVIVRSVGTSDSLAHKMTWAARNGVLASLVPPMFIGTVYDLGTFFYLLIGTAAGGAMTAVEPYAAPHPSAKLPLKTISRPAT